MSAHKVENKNLVAARFAFYYAFWEKLSSRVMFDQRSERKCCSTIMKNEISMCCAKCKNRCKEKYPIISIKFEMTGEYSTIQTSTSSSLRDRLCQNILKAVP